MTSPPDKMGFFSELEDVTRAAIADFGLGDDGEQITLVWKGVSVDVFQEDAEMDLLVDDGGQRNLERPVFRALKANFGANLPKVGDPFTAAGKSYQVDLVTTSVGDPELRITGKRPGAK